MNRSITIGLALFAGAALGAAAVQSLHAQAKLKAYTVSEYEVLDDAANAAYGPSVLAAIKATSPGARNLNTAASRRAA